MPVRRLLFNISFSKVKVKPELARTFVFRDQTSILSGCVLEELLVEGPGSVDTFREYR